MLVPHRALLIGCVEPETDQVPSVLAGEELGAWSQTSNIAWSGNVNECICVTF